MRGCSAVADVTDLARVVQGLLLHEHFAPAYGVTLSDERRSESHIRTVERMLDRVLAHDSQPLISARRIGKRLVGVCRHFTVLLVAMLRAKGVPVRARCGFGAYFNAGRFEDHWVCEYWNERARAAGFSSTRRWTSCSGPSWRSTSTCSMCPRPLRDRGRRLGAMPLPAPIRRSTASSTCADFWFVAGNVMRDFAALNNMEMLPWDVWGAMIRRDEPLAGRPAGTLRPRSPR